MNLRLLVLTPLTFCFVVTTGDSADGDAVEKLVARLGENSVGVHDALVRHGEAAVPALARVLQDRSADPDVRSTAALLLGRVGGKSVVPPLQGALADRNVAYFAVIALGDVGPAAAGALPELADMLRARADDEKGLGWRDQLIAAVASVGHGSKDAAAALARCMQKRRCHEAAYALTKIGEPGAEKLVVLAATYATDTQDEPQRRYGEAYSVLASGVPLPEEMIPAFRQKLLEKQAYRRVAGFGLAAVGTPAIPTLRELLDDRDIDVRAAAAMALGHMNFNAARAREYQGAKAPNPVQADEFFPVIKRAGRLPDGVLDRRFVHAMIRIDSERVHADLELRQILRDDLMQYLLESVKPRDFAKPSDRPHAPAPPATPASGRGAATKPAPVSAKEGSRPWPETGGQPTACKPSLDSGGMPCSGWRTWRAFRRAARTN